MKSLKLKGICKSIMILSLFTVFVCGQELELMQKFNPDLPESGRNASLMGKVVSNIGDINNDNYDDWAFGFPDAADISTGKRVGKVYIYLGSPSLVFEQDPDLILQGENDSDKFGGSIASAGDLNNDGYCDLIVGAAYNNESGISAGRAYIYFGGDSVDNIADLILNGESEGDHFGCAAASAGDVNKDGYDEVIIGARSSNLTGDNTGRAYLYYGGESMDNSANVTFTGEAADDFFGHDVCSAGDVNNDGCDDIMVSAYRNDAAGSDAGRVYIYYGSESMDNTADVVLTGEEKDDYFGNCISSAGDMNNDNYDDVIIGADRNGNGGSAYLFFGGSSMDSLPDVKLLAEASYDYFAASVSSVGDVNNDGYDDVIVGAAYNDEAGTSAGRAYIYFGGLPTDNVPEIVLTGENSYDYFGCSVSSAGDINGDGYTDVIVGAYGNDSGGSGAGRAYIYYGAEKMNNTRDLFLSGELASDWFGCSLSSAGDVNNDGFDDIVIGAKWNDEGGGNAGQVCIYFGGSSIDSAADVILTGQEEGFQFGTSVSSAGDVNNDGFDDLIIGTDYYGARKAYLYYGGTSMDNATDLIFSCGSDDLGFGRSVASAGDVNNDGYDDIIIGSILSEINESEVGCAYIYYGGIIMDNSVDIVLPGLTPNSYFGYSVSSAGDLNDDGYDDVIVGASADNPTGVLSGRAYIFYGGAEMDSSVDVILSGEAEDDQFGASVSSAGDVNDDGYADVVVGAYNNAEGRSYIFFGGSDMDNIADLVLKGEADEDHFGISVSGTGDVNNDGYNDVLVGSEWNSGGGRSAGRCYIYYGGTDIDTVADIIITGEATGDYFGNSVSCAGDVNNDGISDILIGAYGNYAVGAQMGRAYLYAGVDLSDIRFDPQNQFPDQFVLYQNYPNPFNPTTTIRYSVKTQNIASQHVDLSIYNILGQKVATLINKKQTAGKYQVKWNAEGFPSGLYFYRIKADKFMETKRMILIK
ncbi:MAG: FG-GAP repeat protein [Calditrichaceae bacterium]|nr:FG-GAP repeat protein [Calditrichaceae bacterium]